MDEATKMQKFKKWCKENADGIAALSIIGGVIGLSIVTGVAEVKRGKKQLEEYNAWATDTNDWLVDQWNDGRDVYQLANGPYLVIPHDAPRELVIR